MMTILGEPVPSLLYPIYIAFFLIYETRAEKEVVCSKDVSQKHGCPQTGSISIVGNDDGLRYYCTFPLS